MDALILAVSPEAVATGAVVSSLVTAFIATLAVLKWGTERGDAAGIRLVAAAESERDRQTKSAYKDRDAIAAERDRIAAERDEAIEARKEAERERDKWFRWYYAALRGEDPAGAADQDT